MENALLIGLSRQVALGRELDVVANNIANLNTNGFKADGSIFEEFLSPTAKADAATTADSKVSFVRDLGTWHDLSQGPIERTGNPLDIAVDGKGFLVVRTPQGERYTRNGAFVLGKEGFIETKDGFPVLGEKGPIQVKANNFTIDAQGRVWVNEEFTDDPNRLVSMEENSWKKTVLLDTLKVVNFEQPRYLAKQGNSQYRDTENSGAAEDIDLAKRPKIRQGFVEASNVNPVTEMVQMIEVNRAYENNSKMIQTHDAIMNKLINEAAVFR